MISLIIKSYLVILLSIALGAVAIFSLGLYFILRKPKSAKTSVAIVKTAEASAAMQAIESIAGDDVLATQLDLARAYVETGRKQLAKAILESVLVQGSANQQQEAQQLLSSL